MGQPNRYAEARSQTTNADTLRSRRRVPPNVSLRNVDCCRRVVMCSIMLDWLWANVGNACPETQFAVKRELDAFFYLKVP